MIETVQKLLPWVGTLTFLPKLLFSLAVVLVAMFVLAVIWLPQNETSAAEPSTNRRGGDVKVSGSVSAGKGGASAPGGDARIEGGAGNKGALGGNVTIGPGTYKAGDAGSGGAGGNLTIKGGDAK